MTEHSGKTPIYDLQRHTAQEYDAHIEGSPLYQALYAQLIDIAGINAGDNVICLAVGTGGDARAALAMTPSRIVGLDKSHSMIAMAQERSTDNRLQFMQADAAAIPVREKWANAVLMNAAGEYIWNSMYDVFGEVSRVLQTNGTFTFNCQADELERMNPHDPQRELRREVFLLGRQQGLPVKLSAKPTVDLFQAMSADHGLQLVYNAPIGIHTTLDDALSQLQLSQFNAPFLNDIPEEQRRILLTEAANRLRQRGNIENERMWHFFKFQKKT